MTVNFVFIFCGGLRLLPLSLSLIRVALAISSTLQFTLASRSCVGKVDSRRLQFFTFDLGQLVPVNPSFGVIFVRSIHVFWDVFITSIRDMSIDPLRLLEVSRTGRIFSRRRER